MGAMSTNIANGYRLAAGTDPFLFAARLREVMDPARDAADAKLRARLYVRAIDSPWFRGEPIQEGAGYTLRTNATEAGAFVKSFAGQSAENSRKRASSKSGSATRAGAPMPVLPSGYHDYRVLGSGAIGEVLYAHNADCAPVAIKRLRSGLNDPELGMRLFRREVSLMSRLNSRDIPRLLAYQLEGAHPYFVMEYINGRDLEQYVREHGPERVASNIFSIALAPARALAEIHRLGFIHRDIKPSNVMVYAADTLTIESKLIDLGVGKDTGSDSTATQAARGTLAFSPPEYLTASRATPRSDVFSWGATMGYAMTGLLPYGHNEDELYDRVRHGRFDPLYVSAMEAATRDGSLKFRKLSGLVAMCTSADPDRRPRDGSELLRLLSAVTGG